MGSAESKDAAGWINLNAFEVFLPFKAMLLLTSKRSKPIIILKQKYVLIATLCPFSAENSNTVKI